MPYMPYWFESFGSTLPWIVPSLAIAGLWFSKSSENEQIQKSSERLYFAAMLLVAWVALRTAIANEGCWLMHMSSIGAMVLGATFPAADAGNPEQDMHDWEIDNEIMVS
jgi:uncharacterized membrane protein